MTGVTDTLYSRGITLNSCTGAQVTCNYVIGSFPTIKNHSRGIIATISDNCWIGCNYVDSTFFGIFFGGVCTQTLFEGNAINHHFAGLYLNKAAVIDQQPAGQNPPWNGNTWLDSANYSSHYGAVNMNDTLVNLLLSIFSTNQNFSIYNPIIPLDTMQNPFYVNDNGWFAPFPSGSTFNCDSSNICADNFRDNQFSDALKTRIAKNRILTSDYIQESKMIAKQDLYSALKKDSIALASDTVYQNFVDAKQYESIGYLYEAKESLSKIKVSDASTVNILSANDSTIHIYKDSISYIDSLALINATIDYSAIRQGMIDLIISAHRSSATQMQQQQVQDSSNLAAAETKNNNVIPQQTPDENEKFMNEIDLIYSRDGLNAISPYSGQILSVAFQCPYIGGQGVYRARPYAEMFNDSLEFNDDYICEQQGIYRLPQNQPSKEIINDILIKPNPANNSAEITLQGDYKGICTIQFADITGRIIKINTFDCKEKRSVINTSRFMQGVYQIKIIVNGNYFKTAKLVIVR